MIDIKLLIPSVFMIIFMVSWMVLTWDKTVEFRKEKKIIFNEIMRNFVKIISEKFTIIKNNKIYSEIWKILWMHKNLFDKEKKSSFYQNFIMQWLKELLAASEIIFVIIIWYLILKWKWSFADVWVVMMIIWLMKSSLNWLVFNFLHLTNRINWFTNLIETLYWINEIQWYEKWKDFIYKKWEFELKNISFSYKNSKNTRWIAKQEKVTWAIFENFSLKIFWWKKTAIIWRSWSWKSTIIKILMWFVRSQKWDIIVDWQNINNFSLKTFYKYIWYLSQNPWVFDWTVLENLTYWVEDLDKISDKNIKEILKLAECDFVFDLEKWLETEIWEKWVRLSWWERQRLAIARLFLQDPEIIILDEPTSALDSISEHKISKALHNLSEWKRWWKWKRTMIVIAHRLQTVVDSDEIIVLWENKILERWNHDELLRNKWFYFDMVDLQSGKIW